MFAYTGLKPEQMDSLAKEVSFIFTYFLKVWFLTTSLALRLRHQGRPYLRRWYYLRQRRETRRVHLQGYRLNLKSPRKKEILKDIR